VLVDVLAGELVDVAAGVQHDPGDGLDRVLDVGGLHAQFGPGLLQPGEQVRAVLLAHPLEQLPRPVGRQETVAGQDHAGQEQEGDRVGHRRLR
jgi:hypothetical protein